MKPVLLLSLGVILTLGCCYNIVAGEPPAKSSLPGQTKGKAGLEFSWDRVPRALYVSKNSEFTPEEYDYIAKTFSLLVLAINHGRKDYSNYDLAIANSAKEIKTRNASVRVLYYLNAVRVINHYPANAEFEKHPAWALDKSKMILTPGNDPGTSIGDLDEINLSNPEARAWWVKRFQNAINLPNIDGCFIDAVMKIYGGNKLTRLRKLYPPNLFEDGLYDLLGQIKEVAAKAADEPILLGNVIRYFPDNPVERMTPFFNAVFLENHHLELGDEKGPTELKAIIDRTYAAAKSGKVVVTFLGKGPTYEKTHDPKEIMKLLADNLEKRLAFFLITAEQYSYLDYKEDHAAHSDVWIVDCPEFQKPLGRPLGDMQVDHSVYTREFEHCSVTVDIVDMSRTKIVWHEVQKDNRPAGEAGENK